MEKRHSIAVSLAALLVLVATPALALRLATYKIGIGTVAEMPAPTDANHLYLVTDACDETDCTVGGCSAATARLVLCCEGATDWDVCAGGTGGGGGDGDIESVGDCITGACFDGVSGNALKFSGSTTGDGFEGTLTAADMGSDITWTLPNVGGGVCIDDGTPDGVACPADDDQPDSDAEVPNSITVDLATGQVIGGTADRCVRFDNTGKVAAASGDCIAAAVTGIAASGGTATGPTVTIAGGGTANCTAARVDNTVTISCTDTDAQQLFSTIQPSAGDNALADSVTDTLFLSGTAPVVVTGSVGNVITFELSGFTLGTHSDGNYVASVATTSPLAGGAAGSEGAALTLSIANADDDGSTKGAAAFADADFDCTTGVCSIAAAITRDSEVPGLETDAAHDTCAEISGCVTNPITAVGDITGGAAFTGTQGNSLYFEGTSADGNEGTLTAADMSSDVTWTLPKYTGTVEVGHTYDVRSYGAKCDGATNDRAAIQAALDTAYNAGGGTVVIPSTGNDCIVLGHLDVGSNTRMEWMGGTFLKLDPTTSAITYPGWRYGFVDAKAEGPTENVTLVNPLVDCNSVTNANGIAFARDTRYMTVLGGVVRNCRGENTTGGSGGKCLSAQRGAQNIVFQGTHCLNSYIAFAAEGQGDRETGDPYAATPEGQAEQRVPCTGSTCSSGSRVGQSCSTNSDCPTGTWFGNHATEIIFDGVTAEECAIAIFSSHFSTNILDHEDVHALFSNIAVRNCGKATHQFVAGNGGAADAPDNAGAIITLVGAASIGVSNLSVANKMSSGTAYYGSPSAYTTVGSLVRGRGKKIHIENVAIYANLVNLFDFSNPHNGGISATMTGGVTLKDFTASGIRHYGTLSGNVLTAPDKNCYYGASVGQSCASSANCDGAATCARHSIDSVDLRDIRISSSVPALVNTVMGEETDCWIDVTRQDSSITTTTALHRRSGRCVDVYAKANDLTDLTAGNGATARTTILADNGTRINDLAFIGGTQATIRGELDKDIDISRRDDVLLRFKSAYTEFRSKPFKVVTYADTNARDAAVPTPESGMMAYIFGGLSDLQLNKGGTWRDVLTTDDVVVDTVCLDTSGTRIYQDTNCSRTKDNGEHWVDDGKGMYNVTDYGASAEDLTDDTTAIQAAIDAAAPSRTTNSWATQPLSVVYFPGGTYGFMVTGYLVIPEGVFLMGDNVHASRIFLDDTNWTSAGAKIRDANYNGTTSSKNFGFANLTFSMNPNDPDGAAALSGVAMMEFKKVVEVTIRNCRFLMHTYYSQWPPYSKSAASYEANGVTAIKVRETVSLNVDDTVWDRGSIAIHALREPTGANANGMAWGRIRNSYFYYQKDYALRMAHSLYNQITGNVIDIPTCRSAGECRGIWIENDPTDPSTDNIVSNNIVRVPDEPFILDGDENLVIGNTFHGTTSQAPVQVSGKLNTLTANHTFSSGSTKEYDITGRSNALIGNNTHKENAAWYGEGIDAPDSIIVSQDRVQGAGFQWFRPKSVTLTNADTWYDIVSVYMPDANTAAILTVNMNLLLNDVGMKGFEESYFVSRAGGSLAFEAFGAVTETGTAGQLDTQLTAVDANTLKMQIKRTAGLSSTASPILALKSMGQGSRQYTFLLTDLGS